MVQHGRKLTAFRAFTLEPEATFYGQRQTMIEQSRMRYAGKRETVEAIINPFVFASERSTQYGGMPKRKPKRRPWGSVRRTDLIREV